MSMRQAMRQMPAQAGGWGSRAVKLHGVHRLAMKPAARDMNPGTQGRRCWKRR